jgi:virulence-associated protein VagC
MSVITDLEATGDKARLFQSGRSQAVRLPKQYRFTGTDVVVRFR